MSRVKFDVYRFEKFLDYVHEHTEFNTVGKALRESGFKSTRYHSKTVEWSMNEDEYTLFVLRWK